MGNVGGKGRSGYVDEVVRVGVGVVVADVNLTRRAPVGRSALCGEGFFPCIGIGTESAEAGVASGEHEGRAKKEHEGEEEGATSRCYMTRSVVNRLHSEGLLDGMGGRMISSMGSRAYRAI